MARQFNASSDFITVDTAAIAAQNTAFAVALWLKQVAGAADRYVYGEGRSTTTTPLFGIHVNTGTPASLAVVLRNDANSTRLSVASANVQMDNTWHQFIYTQDASNNCTFYTDGGGKETTSYVASGTLTIDRATIGALVRTGLGNVWNGGIAHVALYNYNVGDSDAALLGGGLYPNLLATPPLHYWALDGTASPEPDTGTPGGVPGALTGTTQTAGPTMHGLAPQQMMPMSVSSALRN